MNAPEHDDETAAKIAYDHSAKQFAEGVGTEVSDRFEAPLDRAVLGTFVESVALLGSGPVLDIGCGPGRVAAFVAKRGLDARGVDIAPGMVAEARSAHPALRFDVGTLVDLPVGDHSILGAVYWYSIIATSPSRLPAVWRELDRVLTADGEVLVAFQAGNNEPDERRRAYGSNSDLTLYRHSAADVAASLTTAGFEVRAHITREPELPHETTPQAMLLARRRRP